MWASLLTLGALVRVLPLSWQSLWFDEVFTVQAASGSLSELWARLIQDAQHPPLHYVLTWLILRVGTSEFAVRLPSALMGVATVVLTVRIATRLAGPTAGFTAGLVMALSPFQVYYSHEARDYAQLCLLSVVATGLLVDGVPATRGGLARWRWPAYGLSVAGGMLTNNLMAATVAGHFLHVMAHRAEVGGEATRSRLRPYLLAAGSGTLVWAAWTLAVMAGPANYAQRFAPGGGSWNDVLAVAFANVAEYTCGYSRGFSRSLTDSSAALLVLAQLTGLFYVGVGLWSLRAARSRNLLAWSLVAPFGLALALALKTHFHQTRYAIGGHAPFVILLAVGVELARRRSLPLAMPALLLIALNAVGLRNYLVEPRYQRDDFRALARFFEQRLERDDLIVFNAAWEDQVLAHYFPRPFDRAGIPRGADPAARQATPAFEREVNDAVRAVTRGRKRVWLVLCYDEVTDRRGLVKVAFDRTATRLEQREFAGWPRMVRVYLYAPNQLTGPKGELACSTLGRVCPTRSPYRSRG